MQRGADHRALHRAAWAEAVRVIKSGGRLILNLKNHYRRKVLEEVVQWHLGCVLMDHGRDVSFLRSVPVGVPNLGHGENYAARAECEFLLLVFDVHKQRTGPA